MPNTYTPVSAAEYRQHRGQTRPGVVAFHDSVIFCMGGSVRSGGMVNDRRQRGGTARSLHSVGRAPDFMVQNGTGPRAGWTPKEVGDELFVRLIAAHEAIGLDEAIWWRKRWTPEKGIRPYLGIASHKDHVHAGLDPAMADNAAPYDDLCRWFARAIFGA
jgi:hypothetical protein